MARMFPVNRTQLNKGGAFADRWAGPYKVSEQVSFDSFRLELPITESFRMGRVFNAIELKPYHARTAQSAATAERVAEDDRALATDFPDSDDDHLVPDGDHLVADSDPLVATDQTLPRWQQVMQHSPAQLDEPSEEDAAPVPADAPPRGSTDSPAGQRVIAGNCGRTS